MKELLYNLACAIAQQEGFFRPDSIPQRLNNPGDLRAAPWLASPVIEHGYWHAPSLKAGIAGLFHQIALDVARGLSLRQLVSKWAPPSDGNDTSAYLKHVQTWCMIADSDVDKPLWNLLPDLVASGSAAT